jgi:hypothetical protein
MKFLILLILSFSAHAQMSASQPYPSQGSEVVPDESKLEKVSPVKEVVDEAAPFVKAKALTSEENRAISTGSFLVGFEALSTWLAFKKTLSYTHIIDKTWSVEGEYAWGSIGFPVVGIDIGDVTEKRYTIQARRYTGNSFHFLFGAVLSDLRASLGSDILDSFGQEISTDLGIQNLGVTGGIGNRWQFSNGVTFGIDWLRMNVPIFETKLNDRALKQAGQSGDRSDLRRVVRNFNHVPTYVLFGLSVGYTF